jgi:probable H4MPT-linked C1 transfer pathway protein
MQSVIGWDIGGAHLKAVRIENGHVVRAIQIGSPLWLGPHELERAFAEASSEIGTASLNVATMTAELCDAFASRAEGVGKIAELALKALPQPVQFYAGPYGFVAADAVGELTKFIASANWHASAALAARRHPDALFVDMGSTTTDLIPIRGGKIATHGYSDAERMANGELVYVGVVRSFLMAGLRLVPFDGLWVPLMNEWFANSSDVYRLLTELPEDADLMATADGRDKSVEASRGRLARMLGRDSSDASPQAWTQVARYFAEAQLRAITDGAHLVLSRGELAEDAPIIGAGIGRFVVRRLAERLRMSYVDFGDLFDAGPEIRGKVSDYAPAAALALLAS